MSKRPSNKVFIAAAKRLYHQEGIIEIDDDAKISLADQVDDSCSTPGAYVQAWVWVDIDDITEENQ